MIDMERLRQLASLDGQALEELNRQEARRGNVIPALLDRLRDIGSGFFARQFNHAHVSQIVFDLHCAGYDKLEWRMRDIVNHRVKAVPLIASTWGHSDHFKEYPLPIYQTHTQREVWLTDNKSNPWKIQLNWNQQLKDMACEELRRYVRFWGLRLLFSDVWERCKKGNSSELHTFALVAHFLCGVSLDARVSITAAELRNWWGRASFRLLPNSTLPNYSGAMACVLDALDPTASFSKLRACAVGSRIYVQHALHGITEGEGAAARADLARMLVALYCGCDHRITPKETPTP